MLSSLILTGKSILYSKILFQIVKISVITFAYFLHFISFQMSSNDRHSIHDFFQYVAFMLKNHCNAARRFTKYKNNTNKGTF